MIYRWIPKREERMRTYGRASKTEGLREPEGRVAGMDQRSTTSGCSLGVPGYPKENAAPKGEEAPSRMDQDQRLQGVPVVCQDIQEKMLELLSHL